MTPDEAEGISQGLIIGFSLLGIFAVGFIAVAFWQKNFALAIGVLVATAVHAGVLVYHSEPVIEEKPPVIEETVEIVELPPLEPEDDIEIVESEDAEAPPEFAPPMLMDLPTTVPVSAMTIKFEPPPPEAPKSLGTITIPSNRAAPSGGWGKLFELKDLDQHPVPITRPPPQYPFEMKRQGISGSVRLGFIVDSTGTVRDPYVVESSHREFEQPAIQAIQKWKFRPGKRGGRAVNTRMELPLVFNISG
jgi:protein TonB